MKGRTVIMEDLYIAEEDRNDLERERYALAIERIREIPQEAVCDAALRKYFNSMAAFVLYMDEVWQVVESGKLRQMTLEELQALNGRLYEDILPEHYGESYANPSYAVDCLGESMGQMLSFLCAELRSLIPAVFEQNRSAMVIRMELLLEVYQACLCTAAEEVLPDPEELRQILYWYVSDYYEPESCEKIAQLVCPEKDFALRIVMESDLSDLRYLYYYGEYVTDNELRTAKHLNQMPEERIALLADTYTEGYRIGFETGNKDISIKKTVNVRYCLGFEQMNGVRSTILTVLVCNLRSIVRGQISSRAEASIRTAISGRTPTNSSTMTTGRIWRWCWISCLWSAGWSACGELLNSIRIRRRYTAGRLCWRSSGRSLLHRRVRRRPADCRRNSRNFPWSMRRGRVHCRMNISPAMRGVLRSLPFRCRISARSMKRSLTISCGSIRWTISCIRGYSSGSSTCWIRVRLFWSKDAAATGQTCRSGCMN